MSVIEIGTQPSGTKHVLCRREIKPVTGLAASFGSVSAKPELEIMSAANFSKEAKAAAFRLRSPPAVEAESNSYKTI